MAANRSIVIVHRGAPDLLRWLRSALEPVGVVKELGPGVNLPSVVAGSAAPDLLVASTGVSLSSAVATMSHARAAGCWLPFIIIAGFRDDRVRVFIGGSEPQRFVHRLLSKEELAATAADLVAANDRASSPVLQTKAV